MPLRRPACAVPLRCALALAPELAPHTPFARLEGRYDQGISCADECAKSANLTASDISYLHACLDTSAGTPDSALWRLESCPCVSLSFVLGGRPR